MAENCYVRDVENPALNEQKVNAIAQRLPLVDTTVLSPDFFKKRQHHSSVIGRSRPFRLRKTRANYDIKLLQCGNILLCPASSLALSKPVYIGKVVGLEHYPDTRKVRVKWEFSSSGRKFEFLKKKIDVFLNKFLKELSILPFVQYVSETPVFPVRVHDLTRNQKKRLLLWAEQASKKLAQPHRAKLLLWARQKKYEEILLYKWDIQDSQRRNCV